MPTIAQMDCPMSLFNLNPAQMLWCLLFPLAASQLQKTGDLYVSKKLTTWGLHPNKKRGQKKRGQVFLFNFWENISILCSKPSIHVCFWWSHEAFKTPWAHDTKAAMGSMFREPCSKTSSDGYSNSSQRSVGGFAAHNSNQCLIA